MLSEIKYAHNIQSAIKISNTNIPLIYRVTSIRMVCHQSDNVFWSMFTISHVVSILGSVSLSCLFGLGGGFLCAMNDGAALVFYTYNTRNLLNIQSEQLW